jgi:hypothetical protein
MVILCTIGVEGRLMLEEAVMNFLSSRVPAGCRYIECVAEIAKADRSDRTGLLIGCPFHVGYQRF